MRAWTALAAAAVCGTALIAQQPPPRDVPPPPSAPGTSSITGVVLSDDPNPRPLRRATVVLSGATRGSSQTAVTGDDGTFAFNGLSAGRYSVRALKEAYVPVAYGATRPNRPGTGLTLRGGETASIAIRLPRGAVITGLVTDAEGQPAPGVMIQAFKPVFNPVTGNRELRPEGLGVSASNISDDRGVYRIFGLPAGEYVIAMMVRRPTPNALQQASTYDVRRALAEARGNLGRPSGDMTGGASRTVTMVPVYYPGTTSAVQAERVSLRQSEERSGIDLSIHYTPSATISGTVANLAAGAHTAVTLVAKGENPSGIRRTSYTDGEGGFVFRNIEPGSYLLIATAFVESRAGDPSSPQYATAEVVVDGQDVGGVVLTAQPTLTLAGRLEFEGTPPPAGAIPRTARAPVQVFSGSIPIPIYPVQIEGGQRFRIEGLVPGTFTLGTSLPGVSAPIGRWWLESVVANGRDLLDAPLDIRQSLDDAVATFTERPSELSGSVTDQHGRPAAQTWIVAYSANPQFWFVHSRRVAGVQTDASGRYSIRNLPPGDYLLATSDDLEPNEWFDPSVLERLMANAARARISESESTRADLMVR